KGDRATVRLQQPGSYKLIVVGGGMSGDRWRQEIGCVVQPPQQRPALLLDLPRTAYQPGETLTGTVYSRFADARVLLTLRDRTGLRLWKVLDLRDGKADFKEPLPAGLRYGCELLVQYPGKYPGPPHLVSRFLTIRPADRMLTIQSKLK